MHERVILFSTKFQRHALHLDGLEPAQMGSEVVIFYTDSLELAVLSYHTEC